MEAQNNSSSGTNYLSGNLILSTMGCNRSCTTHILVDKVDKSAVGWTEVTIAIRETSCWSLLDKVLWFLLISKFNKTPYRRSRVLNLWHRTLDFGFLESFFFFFQTIQVRVNDIYIYIYIYTHIYIPWER